MGRRCEDDERDQHITVAKSHHEVDGWESTCQPTLKVEMQSKVSRNQRIKKHIQPGSDSTSRPRLLRNSNWEQCAQKHLTDSEASIDIRGSAEVRYVVVVRRTHVVRQMQVL
jgi:hypothetical protein